jgi:hypothetical protein
VLDTLLGNIVNIGKVVKITYGMTLGGGKEVTMLNKGPWVLGESRNKGTKQCVDNP